MHDIGRMYERLGVEVFEPGICGEFELKRGPKQPATTAEEAAHQRAVDGALRTFAAEVATDHLSGFTSSPSLFEFVTDKVGESVEWLAKQARFAHVLLGTHAALFSPLMPVVWHFHGQQHRGYSEAIRRVVEYGGKVVAYCQQEADLFPGHRLPVIHFGKDPREWCGWIGDEDTVFYAANSLVQRADACHYETFRDTIVTGKWWLAGENNERLGERARYFRFDAFKEQMRRSRLFFNLGTVPAPYSLSPIEAAMTGAPVVTAWYEHPEGCAPYSLPDLLGSGCVVFRKPTSCSVKKFLGDGYSARRRRERLGRAAREAAVKRFSTDRVDAEWRALLEGWMCCALAT